MIKTLRKKHLFEVICPSHWEGETLEDVLKTRWKVPKKWMHEWRMKKSVMLNDKVVHWRTKLVKGDRIQLPLFQETPFEFQPYKREVEILYEDEHMLIANKPAGMKTHPNDQRDRQTLLQAVIFHLQKKGEHCFIRHVHRLDENTSGAVLFAKHPLAYSLLSSMLEKRDIKRTYWAIVHGPFKKTHGMIEEPIGRDRHHPTRRRVSKTGQKAITHYRVIKTDSIKNLSLLECTLDTGRTHQIRVHLSYIHHPLAGDQLYGGKPIFPRPALHARKIEWFHPFTEKNMKCQAPFLDEIFSEFQK
ncbi:23S rRNA pseudouridine1911/1915/1917 synthase [Oikeobacillus pervagus]|uniref:Pseudouridine synthase n=1 Tax=Oikeobacillus pervagus TaxID=1325931 RepID=A0AAJ1WIS4_9BACI|nr:RluA family pseudouridine synthase [Oikeobacillus pervagus]MDQ0214713.1 23S rRNA pseudouridine1911/1915/1917 synthase [Oikeobacillus pervagus]